MSIYAPSTDCAWCGTGEGICETHAEAIYSQQAQIHETQDQQQAEQTNTDGQSQDTGKGGRR